MTRKLPRTAFKKGHTVSEEIRKKISESKKGKKTRLGAILSEETKKKLSRHRKGKTWEEIFGPEQAKRMREQRRLQRLNSKQTEETKRKIGQANSSEKNGNWMGGIMYSPYGFEFTKALRRAIRERDNYQCQMNECGKNARCVHHIDYDKNNNDPKNLITLCCRCHGKTGINREYWRRRLNEVISKRMEAD